MKVTIGSILKEIRIRSGWTLRNFCIMHKLDAIRYSLIERDVLDPNLDEVGEYLILIEKSR